MESIRKIGPLSETASEADRDMVVFSILKPSACAECGEELWKGSFLRMEKGKPLCLECADLDHLVMFRGEMRRSRAGAGNTRTCPPWS